MGAVEFVAGKKNNKAVFVLNGNQRLQIMNELHKNIHSRHLQVLMGNKNVEVRLSGINKRSSISKIIGKQEYDFIIVVGDDRTDENIFRACCTKRISQ